LEKRVLEKLIKQCCKGKYSAQEALYREFAPQMLGVCMRYSPNQADAEDTLQEAFLKIFDNIGSFKFKGAFEGWMRRIMVNTALEKYRKNKSTKIVEETDIYIKEYEENDLNNDSEIPLSVLLEMIQDLPERYRMVFNLYALDGYSHNEIAEVMSISVGTSKSNLSRARVILQKKVKIYRKTEESNLKVC
jgi:RNA polymerase sigma-70 factor (ECF subfamily)